MSENQKWADDLKHFLDNPPAQGTVLKAYGDVDAKLEVVLTEGKQPFIYGKAYVPCVVGSGLGWYLQGVDQETAHGWKCILMPKARQELIQAKGLNEEGMAVKALRVIRYSDSKKSMLCEIAEI